MGSALSGQSSPVPRIHFPDTPVHLMVKSSNEDDSSNNTEPTSLSLRTFVQSRCPSLLAEYRPVWWLFNGHLQTAYCVFGDFSVIDNVIYERRSLRLVDGGTLGLDLTPPFLEQKQRDMRDETPVIVVSHGLTGGSYESYVRNILAPACAPVSKGGLGFRAVVVNFRGCAGVPLTSPQLYCGGHTDDLRQALMFIAKTFPKAPLLGLGFSLGANVLVKYLAEEGSESRLQSGCALGCPWDFVANNDALMGDIISRNVYAKSLGTNLVNLVRVNETAMRSFQERNCARQVEVLYNFKGGPMLEDFDNMVTSYLGGSERPHGPFPLKNAQEYYTYASTHKIVANVRVPLLTINAADDPVVQKVPMDAGGNPWAAVVLTASGGHLGWFESSGYGSQVKRWISKPVLEWLRAVGNDLITGSGRGRALREIDGFLKEEGDDRLHLGYRELDAGGIVVGTDGDARFLSGL